MERNRHRELLRLLLAGAGIGWAVSVIGVFLPWPLAVRVLQDLGGVQAIPNDPMANYWLRMAAGGFTFVGTLFLLCAWSPESYARLIPVLGVLSLLQGGLLLVYGLVLGLDAMPFAADVAICLLPGIGILALHKSVRPD